MRKRDGTEGQLGYCGQPHVLLTTVVPLLVFTLDRLTKVLALSLFADRVEYNTGIAFGWFKQHNAVFVVISSVFACLVTVVLIKKSTHFFPVGLVLGGVLGNLFDRVFYRGVIDFLSVGPISSFNFADLAVCIGFALLVYDILKRM